MKGYSYEQVVDKIQEFTELKRVYDKLHTYGIPRSLAPYFISCDYPKRSYSGYSMGELICVCFKGDVIVSYDNRKDYAKSCKWKPKHGYVKFNFTSRKTLRMYCEACKRYVKANEGSPLNTLIDATNEVRSILVEALDKTSLINCKKKTSVV